MPRFYFHTETDVRTTDEESRECISDGRDWPDIIGNLHRWAEVGGGMEPRTSTGCRRRRRAYDDLARLDSSAVR